MGSLERLEIIAASFRTQLSSEEFVAINKIKTFADLQDAIRDIEAKQVLSKSIRNINKIRPFVNSLQQYTGVIEVFVNVKPDFLALIWGPIKLCLLVSVFCNASWVTVHDSLSSSSGLRFLEPLLTYHTDERTMFWGFANYSSCRSSKKPPLL